MTQEHIQKFTIKTCCKYPPPPRIPRRKINGFSLIELLVVVIIIGILAALALPQYQKAVEKSKIASWEIIAQKILQEEEIYKLMHGSYATNWIDLDSEIQGTLHYNNTRLEASGADFILYNIGTVARVLVYAGGVQTRYVLGYRSGLTGVYCCSQYSSIGNKICETYSKPAC